MTFKEIVDSFERLEALFETYVPFLWEPKIEDIVLRCSKMHEVPDMDKVCFWRQSIGFHIYQLELYVYLYWDEILKEDPENLEIFIDFLKKKTGKSRVFIVAWTLTFWAKILTTDKRDEILPYLAELLQTPKMISDTQNYYFQSLTAEAFSNIMVALTEFCIPQQRPKVCYTMLNDRLFQLRQHYPQVIKAVFLKLRELRSQADFSIKEVQEIYVTYKQK